MLVPLRPSHGLYLSTLVVVPLPRLQICFGREQTIVLTIADDNPALLSGNGTRFAVLGPISFGYFPSSVNPTPSYFQEDAVLDIPIPKWHHSLSLVFE